MITDSFKKINYIFVAEKFENKALWYKNVCNMNSKNQLERKIKILVQWGKGAIKNSNH